MHWQQTQVGRARSSRAAGHPRPAATAAGRALPPRCERRADVIPLVVRTGQLNSKQASKKGGCCGAMELLTVRYGAREHW
jgi:hypothetical protein